MMMAPEPWSPSSVANPTSPLDDVRPENHRSWRDLHLAPGHSYPRGSLINRTILFSEGHSAVVVKRVSKKLHQIRYDNGRQFTIELRAQGRDAGEPFEVLRDARDVSQRKARRMARATQRMPEVREQLLSLMRGGKLKHAFEAWDANGDETLSATELEMGLGQLGVPEADARQIIEAGGGTGEDLSYRDFTQVLASLDASQRLAKKLGKQLSAQLQSEKHTLIEAFDKFDDDGDGVLTRKELVEGLKVTMKNCGLKLSNQDKKELMLVLDSDGDGTVDYHEFVKFLTQDDDAEQQLKVKELQAKFRMYQAMSPKQLRDECWKQDLDDHGDKHDLASRLTAAYSEVPDDTEWIPGDTLSADEIRNQEVLVMGHGKCTVTEISQGWYGPNQHTLQPLDGRQTITISLKSKENNGKGIDFKLARRRSLMARVILEKTPNGFGLNIAEDGRIIDVSGEKARTAGAQPDTFIREIDGQKVSNKQDILGVLGEAQEGQRVVFSMLCEPSEVLADGVSLQRVILEKTPNGFGLNVAEDGRIIDVSGEKARTAGAQPDTFIREIDGQKVSNKQDILGVLGEAQEGQRVVFSMWHQDGSSILEPEPEPEPEPVSTWLKLAEQPEPEPEPEPESDFGPMAVDDPDMSVEPSWPEWAKGSSLADEIDGQKVLLDRKVRVERYGIGHIRDIRKPWSGPRQYTVHFVSGQQAKMSLASKDNGGQGTAFWVKRTPREINQSWEKERASKIFHSLTTEVAELLATKSANLRDFFEAADANGDGKLTVKELFDGIQMMTGKKMGKGKLQELMSAIDMDGDNEVSWNELAQFFLRAEQKNQLAKTVAVKFKSALDGRGKNVMDAFQRFDKNGDGKLSQKEFLDGLKELDVRLSSDEVTKIMGVLDSDGDNEIDYSELADFFDRATADEDEFVQRQQAKRFAEKYAEFDLLEDADLRRLCWERGLDDVGSKQQCCSLLAEHCFVLVPEEWQPGDHLSDDMLVGKRVLVQGYGKGTLRSTQKRSLFGSAARHEFLSERTGDLHTVTLKTKDDPAGTPFKLFDSSISNSGLKAEPEQTRSVRSSRGRCACPLSVSMTARINEAITYCWLRMIGIAWVAMTVLQTLSHILVFGEFVLAIWRAIIGVDALTSPSMLWQKRTDPHAWSHLSSHLEGKCDRLPLFWATSAMCIVLEFSKFLLEFALQKRVRFGTSFVAVDTLLAGVAWSSEAYWWRMDRSGWTQMVSVVLVLLLARMVRCAGRVWFIFEAELRALASGEDIRRQRLIYRYEQLSIADLQQECDNRWLISTGRHSDLVERIVNDHNQSSSFTTRSSHYASGGSGEYFSEDAWVPVQRFDDATLRNRRIRHKAIGVATVVGVEKAWCLPNKHILLSADGTRISLALQTKDNKGRGDDCEVEQEPAVVNKAVRLIRSRRLGHLAISTLRGAVENQKALIADAFRDSDAGDGSITIKQLQSGLNQHTGVSLKLQHLKDVIASSINDSGDDSIDWREFLEAFQRAECSEQLANKVAQRSKQMQLNATSELLQIFTELDSNDDGVISQQQLQIGLRKLGILSTHDMADLMSAMDKDGSITVDYRVFVARLDTFGTVCERYSHMGPDELRAECSRRNLLSTGSTADMLERIVDRHITQDRPNTTVSDDDETTHRDWVEGTSFSAKELVGSTIVLDGIVSRVEKFKVGMAGFGSHQHIIRVAKGGQEQTVRLRTKDNLSSGKSFRVLQQHKSPEARAALLLDLLPPRMKQLLTTKHQSLDKELRKVAKGQGTVSLSDIQAILSRLTSEKLGIVELQKLLTCMGPDGDNSIDWGEFCHIVRRSNRSREFAKILRRFRQQLLDRGDDLQTLFDSFDTDGNGILTDRELRHGLRKIGITLSDLEVDELMRFADANSDNSIDWHEFLEIMGETPSDHTPPQPSRDRHESEQEHRARGIRTKHIVATEIHKALRVQGLSLDDIFRKLDTDQDGRLSAKEVQQGLLKLTGKKLRKSHLHDMLDLTDSDDSTIEWTDFRNMYQKAHNDQQLSNQVLRRCRGTLSLDTFRQFDRDGDGSVSKAEMRKGLESIGIDLTKAQIDGLFAVVDINGDGSIDYQEFVSLANLDDGDAAEFALEAERRERLRAMALPELKRICADEGIDSSGLKDDLIVRLLQLRREDEAEVWEDAVSRPSDNLSTPPVHHVDDRTHVDGNDTVAHHNLVWRDGSSIMGHNLTPGTLVDVEGHGQGKVLGYKRAFRGANEHTIEFARGQRRSLPLRTSDSKGRGKRFQAAQQQADAEDATTGAVYKIEKMSQGGFGMKINDQGIITELPGKNARDAGVPIRGTVTRVNGERVNGLRDILAVLGAANGGRGCEFGQRVSFQIETSLGAWVNGYDWDDKSLKGRRVNVDGKGIGRVVHCDKGTFKSVFLHTVEMDDGRVLKNLALRTRGNAKESKAVSFTVQLTAAETKSRMGERRAKVLANAVSPRERKCLIDRYPQLEQQLQERAGSAQVVPFAIFEQVLSDVMKTAVSTKMLRQHFIDSLAPDEREYDDESLDWSVFCAGFAAAYRGQRLAAILSQHRQHLLSRASDLLEWCEDTSSGNNVLAMKDLKSLLSKIGVKLSKTDLAQMDEYADMNGDVNVDFRELIAHIKDVGPEEELPRQRYAHMSVPQLRAECERKGLDTTGPKSDLVHRLVSPVYPKVESGRDTVHDPVANDITKWLPGEQFSARDIVGRTVHVRTKGRGRVNEMHKGFVWGSLQHQVSLGRETQNILLRCKENATARGAVEFRVEPDETDLKRARRVARARRVTHLITTKMREGMKLRDMSLEEAFGRIDANGDGVLSLEEFATGLEILTGNDSLSVQRIREVIQTVDTDEDDSIDWIEFREMFERGERAQKMATRIMNRFHSEIENRGASLLEAFDSIDANGDGFISQKELMDGLRQIGVKISSRDAEECMSVLDGDGNAQLDYREFIEAARTARVEARSAELSSHLHDADLSELKQLCADQGVSSRGLKSDLIERLMEIGLREEPDVWVDDGPDMDVWMHGHDVPDNELEGQSVNVKGFGNGRVVQIESRGWGGSLHTVELGSGDKFTISLASLNNSGDGTAFVVRRDQQTIAQNQRHAQALQIITPVLLRALMKRGADLQRALRAADEDDEGVLPHRKFVRTLLHVVGGEQVLGPAAAHHIMSRLDKHADGVDWKAFCSAFERAECRRNLATVVGRRRGTSSGQMLAIFKGVADGNNKLSRTDFITGLRALQLRPKLSRAEEDEVLRILGQGPFDFRIFVSDLQEALALAGRIKDAQEIATVLLDNCRSQLDDFTGDLVAHFEELDADEDGLLSQQQLMAGLRRLEIRLSRSEQQELVSVMDDEGDGKLDYRELVGYLRPTVETQDGSMHVASWKLERHTRAQLLARAAVVRPDLRQALLASVDDLRAQCSALDTAANGALSREAFERALLSLSKMGTHRLHDVIALQDETAALESGLRSVYRERDSQHPEKLARALFKQLGKRVDVKWVEAALPLVADGGTDASIEWSTFCDVVEMCERTERLANLVKERFRARLPDDCTPLSRTLKDFDSKEVGHISLTEALVGLWEHGLKMQSTEVNLVVGSIGSENTVDYTELVELLGRKRKHAAKRSSSAPRIHRGLSGTPLSQRQMQEMMNRDLRNPIDSRRRSTSVSRPSRHSTFLSRDPARRSGLTETRIDRSPFFAPDDSYSTSSDGDSDSDSMSAEELYVSPTRSGRRSPPPSPRHAGRSSIRKLRLSPSAQGRVRTPPHSRGSRSRSRSRSRSVASRPTQRPAPPPLPATMCPNRYGVHKMHYMPADDCICDGCAEQGFERIGTDYSCANGCDFDLCAACYREQQTGSDEAPHRQHNQGGRQLNSKASPHRQRLHAAVNEAARTGLVRATSTSTVGDHRMRSDSRARILLTPTAPGALNGVRPLPRSRQPTALACSVPGSATGIEYEQVCQELQAELTSEHASWLMLPPPRLDQLPLLSILPAVKDAARQAMLRRLGGSGGMSALVLDLAPLPAASVLQPPPSTATAKDGGSGVAPFALVNLKSYCELGWFWGGVAALGWKGCFLAGVVLYTVINYGCSASTVSLGLLFGRLVLSAPSLVYTLKYGTPPPVHSDTEVARAINACPTVLEICADRAAQLIDVGALRSAAVTLKVTTDSVLINAHRHGFGVHSRRLDSLNHGPAGVRHAALFESIARSWEHVLVSENPGLSPSELQIIAAWFRAWTDAEHPVMGWWQDEQHFRGTLDTASRGRSPKSGCERRWAAAYGLLSPGTPGRLRCCPPNFDSAAVEALALSRARLAPAGSWALPRDTGIDALQAGTQLAQDDDEHIDAVTPEAIVEAIAETLLGVTWDDMGSAALIQLWVTDDVFRRPPSRKAFERAMEKTHGVAGVFSSQPERPATYRFYDLGAVEKAFGRSPAMRERHLSESDGGLRRRWVQQLQVEHRPARGRTSKLGAGYGIMLTVWPCEASWRDISKQWAVSDPSYDLLVQAS